MVRRGRKGCLCVVAKRMSKKPFTAGISIVMASRMA